MNNKITDSIKILRKDFEKFSNNFLYIRNKNSSLTNFIFNKEQCYINNLLNQQKEKTGKVRALILKGRQIGVTTYVSSRCYHHTVFNMSTKSLVLTHRTSATNNIFDMMLRYYNNSPNFLKPDISINNYKYMLFRKINSACTFATAGSNEIGRSDTIQFFHGSEVAFWKNSDNHLSSILMAVPDVENTEIVLESTSNGFSGMFYNMCINEQEHEYQLVFLPWHWHAEYVSSENIKFSSPWLDYKNLHSLSREQLSWAYLKNKSLCSANLEDIDKPSERFHREFPASVQEAFINGGNNKLIPLNILLSKSLKEDFFKGEGSNYSAELRENFLISRNNSPIFLGVDVARGGKDFSWIIDRQGSYIGFNINEKINTSNTMDLVGIIIKYIEKFMPDKVCIDAGGGGFGVYDRLCELGYQNQMVLVNFGEKAFNSKRYFNKRAEMWGSLEEFIKHEGYIIEDNTLLKQISDVEYYYTSLGQLRLESKNILKSRLKESPDGGDACVLTFACDYYLQPYTVKEVVVDSHNFDPFSW